METNYLKTIKQYLKQTSLYPFFRWVKFVFVERRSQLSPSASISKRLFIKNMGQQNNIDIFVETGTYLGDTIKALKNVFKTIYSVELDNKLAKRASKIFKKYDHIHIIQGDSEKILFNLLPQINQPTLFWLDAHCLVE